MSVFNGTGGDDSLVGSASGDDFHLEQGGEDSASGNAGVDVFYLGATFDAGDHIDGGADGDFLILAGDYSAGVAFNATTLTNVETIRLGAGFDYNLFGLTDANVGAGLTIDGHTLNVGDDLSIDASGATGWVHISGGSGLSSLTGGDGDDELNGYAGTLAILRGGKGADVMAGSFSGADVIGGGQGGDTIAYGQGAASISGGAGNDRIFRTSPAVGSATVDGGDGNDRIDAGWLGAGAQITGGAGNDQMSLNGTADPTATVDGGQGSDRLIVTGDAGVQHITAGQFIGFENLTIGGKQLVVLDDYFVAAGQTLQIGVVGRVTFDGSAERDGGFAIDGSNADDAMTGGAQADLFRGGQGDDTLIGGKGDDTLSGGYGADRLEGGAGADVLDGGAVLRFEAAADTLSGGAGDDIISAASANSSLDGGSGADMLTATAAGATLTGGAGDDVLIGHGDSLLYGGAGQDSFSGGRLLYMKAHDSTAAAPDQVHGAGPVDLQHIDADKTLKGDQAFHWADALTGEAGQLVLTYDDIRDRSILEGDVNGDGVADFVVQFDGHVTSGAGFVL